MQPCKGRIYSRACYLIKITLLDRDLTIAKSFMPSKSDDQNTSGLTEVIKMLLIVLTICFFTVLSFYLLRRKKQRGINPDVVQVGDFKFNSKTMVLTSEKLRIELTGKETDLLQLLLSSVNNTVERTEILKSVWGDEGDYVGRTLDVFISKLRKKLEADSNLRIVNIRGIGYKLVMNSEQNS